MRFFPVVCCLLMALGCRQNPQVASSIELMNAERRALEDQLYELEFEYESAVEEIEHLQETNEELRSQIGGSAPARSRSTPRRSNEESSFPDLSPPRINEGDLTAPQIELPNLDDGAATGPTPAVPVSSIRSRISLADPRITRLEIHPRRTRGIDLDSQPGDDGLEVVLEPLNSAGDLVALPGPVTVVALDYALRGEGERARVARWDLTAEQVGRFLRDTPTGRGIHLQLLWPDSPPEHSRLRLDVRYQTMDGRNVEARRNVTIRLPSSAVTQRWTPRSESSGPEVEVAEPTPLTRPEWTPYR